MRYFSLASMGNGDEGLGHNEKEKVAWIQETENSISGGKELNNNNGEILGNFRDALLRNAF